MGKTAQTHTRESPLSAEVRLAVGSRRDFLLARINTGVFLPIDWMPGKPKRHIRSAPTGFPDLSGVQLRRTRTITTINPEGFNPLERQDWLYYGQTIYVETKSAKGEQRKQQQDWQEICESVGAIYILARTVDDVLRVLGPEPDMSDWDAKYLPANLLVA